MQTIPTSDIINNAPLPALQLLQHKSIRSKDVKIILLEYGFGAEMLKIIQRIALSRTLK